MEKERNQCRLQIEKFDIVVTKQNVESRENVAV